MKRSSDTRIRREVVGQMLDYAANATVYWPADRIRTLASATCGGPDKLDEAICNLIGVENNEDSQPELENFWRRVDGNLRNGELRLLFVADELPRELRRIIEFLNEHMPRIEVLGVEIREFAGSNMRAVVPRVIGQTERARQEKASPPLRKTSANEFIEKSPEWCRPFFEDLFGAAAKHGFRIAPGTKGFSIRVPQNNGKLVSLLWGFPPGSYSRPAPAIDVFLSYLSPFEKPDEISKSLMKVAPFKLSGDQLSLQLEPGNLKSAGEALAYLWVCFRQACVTSSPDS